MRIAVLSDTHGNATAFEAVLKDMKRQSPDTAVFLGDLVMRGPEPEVCVELVRELKPLAIIRGNYDDKFDGRYPAPGWLPASHKQELVLRAFEYDCSRLSAADRSWLASLPEHVALELGEEAVPTELVHATSSSLVDIVYPWASLEELEKLYREERTKLILCGHVHHAYTRQARGRQIVNGGSIGLPFDGDNRASYAIVDLDGPDLAVQLRRVTYDIERAVGIARANRMPDVEAFEYALRYARYPYNAAVPASS